MAGGRQVKYHHYSSDRLVYLVCEDGACKMVYAISREEWESYRSAFRFARAIYRRLRRQVEWSLGKGRA